MNPLAQTPGSPSAQIIELLQSHMPAVDSNGCVVDRTLLCKHPHACLAIDPEQGDLCCTACSLVVYAFQLALTLICTSYSFIRRQRKIVTLSMPNAETGSSVSDIDVPNRLKTKGVQGVGRGEWIVKKRTEEIEYPSGDGHVMVKETKVTVGLLLCSPRFTLSTPFLSLSNAFPLQLAIFNYFLQVTSPDGKHKYTYYENVDGEDEEDEDVSNDGSWEANLQAQCRCFLVDFLTFASFLRD